MARPRAILPRYLHHKPTNRAYVRVDGRFTYLGLYGSPESREAYARFVRDYQMTGSAAVVSQPDAALDQKATTVAQVVAGFWSYAKTVYPYDPSYESRRPPGEIGNYWDVIRPVLKLYGGTQAVEFGPKAMAMVQHEMITLGWCRNVINRHTGRIKRIFKWASGKGEMLPGEVGYRLSTAEGLREGHPLARSTGDVPPVPEDHLAATLRFCSPRIAAMIRVQYLTGLRSGNLVMMRTAEIDTGGSGDGSENWIFRPRKHKTMHHGHKLAIALGPEVQDVLRQFLLPDDPEAFLFSPREEAAERRAARTAARKTPLSTGNRAGAKPAKKGHHPPGEHYTPRTYAQAIDRACDKANRWAKGGMIIGDDERAIPRWHPHQLRHNKASRVRPKYGLDGVQASLGLRTSKTAERYARLGSDLADRIATEIG